MENYRKETIARIQTVRWRWMLDELVDEEAREFEIYRFYGCYYVRAPHGSAMPLGSFFTNDSIGRRIRQLYQHFNRQRLEDLDGATIDLYPRGAARMGYGVIGVEGSLLHGQSF